MSKILQGKVSVWIDEVVTQRTLEAVPLNEIAKEITEQLRAQGFDRNYTLTAVNMRRMKLKLKKPEHQAAVPQEQRKKIPLLFKADDAFASSAVWNSVHLTIIQELFQESRKFHRKSDLVKVRQRLLERLRTEGQLPLLSNSSLNNFINGNRDKIGHWGNPRKTEKEHPMKTKLLQLATVWNQPSTYPANYDMERALGASIRTIRKQVEKYRDFVRDNPNEARGLPELIYRDRRGGHVAVPPSVQKQLDEFRFDHDAIKNEGGIIVTAAQFGAPLFSWGWQSLANYAAYRGFSLAVLPIKYGAVKTVYQKELGERQLTSTFPDELKGHVILDDVEIGDIRLSTVRLRPTLQRFLTDEVCLIGGNASVVFGAPSFELDYRPRIGHKHPKAIMTTGAITHPNYMVDNLGQQDRTGLIAAARHCYGAILIEYRGKEFHFRQLHLNKKGEFYDFTDTGDVVFCTPKKIKSAKHAVSAVVPGDWHTGKTDPVVRRATIEAGGLVPTLQPETVVIHDFFDGDSIAHHGEHEKTRKAFMAFAAPQQWDSLQLELDAAVEELRIIQKLLPKQKLVLIPSNHPEFVAEYINSMRWTKEPTNMTIGAELFGMMVESLKKKNPKKVDARATDPIALWFRKHVPGVRVIERKESYVVNNILLSLHGDIGTRGAKTRSILEFRKMNTKLILGHNHTGTILGPLLWRVGTSTPTMQFYVENPVTNWTNTHAVVYENGQVQLVNIVNGRWHLNSKTFTKKR